jgi:hypothetical protein
MMSRKNKSSNASDPSNPKPVPLAESEPVRKKSRMEKVTVAPISRTGKPVQFWLHDEDRQLVRELAAWLAGQGIRSTDSMVIRAALRTAKTGGELLDAYREAAQLDGRLKQHKADRFSLIS